MGNSNLQYYYGWRRNRNQLPADYRRVLCLTSKVGAGIWIYPTIDWSKTVVVRVKASMPASGTRKCMMGNYNYSDSGEVFMLEITDADKWRIYHASSSDVAVDYPLSANTPYVFESVFTPNTGSVNRIYAENGTLLNETSGFAMTGTTTTLILFRDGRTNRFQPLSLYHVEIIQDHIKLFDMVPAVRNSDSKPGMWDLCGNLHYGTNTPFHVKGSVGNEFAWEEIQ